MRAPWHVTPRHFVKKKNKFCLRVPGLKEPAAKNCRVAYRLAVTSAQNELDVGQTQKQRWGFKTFPRSFCLSPELSLKCCPAPPAATTTVCCTPNTSAGHQQKAERGSGKVIKCISGKHSDDNRRRRPPSSFVSSHTLAFLCECCVLPQVLQLLAMGSLGLLRCSLHPNAAQLLCVEKFPLTILLS